MPLVDYHELKKLRKRALLTQVAVAKWMGRSVEQVSKWENGRVAIPVSVQILLYLWRGELNGAEGQLMAYIKRVCGERP